MDGDIVINIANVVSAFFLVVTLIILIILRRKKTTHGQVNLFFIVSMSILLLVTITNLLEHFEITPYFDLYEDSLELMFVPFIIFALYSSRLNKENERRERAEFFSTKIIETNPTITYIYNVENQKLSYFNCQELINKSVLSLDFKVRNGEELVGFEYFISKCITERDLDISSAFELTIISGGNELFFQVHETVLSESLPGRVKEIVGVAVDVTERKIAENQLIDYKDQLEDLVKERTEKVIKQKNQLEAFNVQLKEQNINLTEMNIVLETQREEINSLNKELSEKNESLAQFNEEVLLANEQLEETMNRLTEMQARLVQSEKLSSLGVLIAGIAHEINNPVNFISSGMIGMRIELESVELGVNKLIELLNTNHDLKQMPEVEAVYSNFIESLGAISKMSSHIQTGIDRITSIILSLRQYTRSSNELKERVDIHTIIDTVLIMLKHEYTGRIQIVKKYTPLPLLFCYSGKINQLVMNLLSNSVQAIEHEGRIEIETSFLDDTNHIKIAISDTGSGIPEGVGDKIFDPFFTTKAAGKGTGLGLSISFDVVHLHGGEIHSRNLPQGALFEVLLPVHEVV